jgi:putative transposase
MHARREHVMAAVRAHFEATLAEFNGGPDHVHLLVQYRPQVVLSHLVNSLNGLSSKGPRQDVPASINTAAMHGRFCPPSYLARSRGGAPLATVKDDIDNQKRPDQEGLPAQPQGQGLRPRSPTRSQPTT